MASNGFFEQKQGGPGKFGMVLALHAAAIGGVLMIKGPIIDRLNRDPIDIIPVRPDPPPPEPDRPRPERPRDILPTDRIDRPPVVVETPLPPSLPGPVDTTGPTIPIGTGTGTETVPTPPAPPPSPPPPPPVVRAGPSILRSSALQPPYPLIEQRAGNEGSVQVRVSIDASGRVSDVQLISATSDAFYRATEQQALSRWRFRPATEDGRPVASSMVMTVRFNLDAA